MNTAKFNEKISEINDNSWGYGNEILYLMGSDTNGLDDDDKLSGAIWLIGRSYAASPQRRNYGKTKTGEKYTNNYGESVTRPIWPVKTQNDGREGFFDAVAQNLDVSCLNDIRNCHLHDEKYCYDTVPCEENNYAANAHDIELLAKSIDAVLTFDKNLSLSIENFDLADRLTDGKFKGEEVACNRHISFASKFLHFYFPHLVFIIDSFANNGGSWLFNGDTENKKRYIIDPPTATEYFEADVYGHFESKAIKELKKKIQAKLSAASTASDSETVDTDEKIKENHYITHCARSYILGCYIKNKTTITPKDLIRFNSPLFSLQSMPRLTDAIFLNIKKAPMPKDEQYAQSLWDTFYRHI